VAAFEDWSLPGDVSFDLVFAASAWHWIDPNIGYRKAARSPVGGGRSST
jgi:hypothetical protein